MFVRGEWGWRGGMWVDDRLRVQISMDLIFGRCDRKSSSSNVWEWIFMWVRRMLEDRKERDVMRGVCMMVRLVRDVHDDSVFMCWSVLQFSMVRWVRDEVWVKSMVWRMGHCSKTSVFRLGKFVRDRVVRELHW